ncbi:MULTISPECIES: mycofactocin precursor MftA [Nesterenkonia]|uniref:Mycofactocin n=1 Tax=Nesterenkonia alkaliphila TaxID=1463631 RepID=A0A7K1UFD9_9MICC|nr:MULTISPECIES: mycofactocin precursor MftA [Nesterenkonia]MVT25190.1 mycofactocin precursor [Nesterenkonia alkaliphila]GFZ93691.1 hypothetical protein GCM10011359_24000 [Nesterenkonia alkaliphila]
MSEFDPKQQAEADREDQATVDAGVQEDALVEEVSIDGMCGVY